MAIVHPQCIRIFIYVIIQARTRIYPHIPDDCELCAATFFQKLPETGIDINQIDVDRKKLLKQLQSVS